MHQPAVTAPLASATSHAQLDELLAAPTVTLDQAEISRLNTAADDPA
jgi:aryl-alcohol dehydrogenase (NADP+)